MEMESKKNNIYMEINNQNIKQRSDELKIFN